MVVMHACNLPACALGLYTGPLHVPMVIKYNPVCVAANLRFASADFFLAFTCVAGKPDMRANTYVCSICCRPKCVLYLRHQSNSVAAQSCVAMRKHC